MRNKKTTSVSFEKSTLEELTAHCTENNLNRSSLINSLVQDYLNKKSYEKLIKELDKAFEGKVRDLRTNKRSVEND